MSNERMIELKSTVDAIVDFVIEYGRKIADVQYAIQTDAELSDRSSDILQ